MEINIAYSFDNNFAQHGGCSLLSLLYNNQDIELINIFIIEDDISIENKEKLNSIANQYGRTITYLDLTELTKELNIPTIFSRCAYGRLFLHKLGEIDKILYFDSDTIIRSSIKDLWNEDMDGYLTAGVKDAVNPFFIQQIGLSSKDPYINDGGVLILNLELWRKLNIHKQAIDFIVKYKGNPPHHDQGTINYVSKGRIKILSPKYNVMNTFFLFDCSQIMNLFQMTHYYNQSEINMAKENPVIIHYTAEIYNRPWFSNCSHPLKNEYRSFLRLSPWLESYSYSKMTLNCRIQNFIYKYCPFFTYKLMIRFIKFEHIVREKL